uniref:Uncharacterized protein n=1 Tax=Anguilla anguilla TaxID=7936 RepID=A0A0E9VAU4_ANGAN
MLHESSSPSSRLLPSQNSQAAQMLLESGKMLEYLEATNLV